MLKLKTRNICIITLGTINVKTLMLELDNGRENEKFLKMETIPKKWNIERFV